jgi:hypothetical protein
MDAQMTTHDHPDHAYGNIARSMKRPADSPNETLFPAGMPRSHPRPQCGVSREMSVQILTRARVYRLRDTWQASVWKSRIDSTK